MSYTASYTVGANAAVGLYASNFNITEIAEYTAVAVKGLSTDSNGVLIRQIGVNSVVIRNITSSSVTATCYLDVLYAKTNSIS